MAKYFFQLSGKESLVERWILNKLNEAATEINRELAVRNFMNATNAAYNFWLYELCDVYIVSLVLCLVENHFLIICPMSRKPSSQ